MQPLAFEQEEEVQSLLRGAYDMALENGWLERTDPTAGATFGLAGTGGDLLAYELPSPVETSRSR